MFIHPIPYAIWTYTSEDFMRNDFHVYSGDGLLLAIVHNTNSIWKMWNKNGAIKGG